MKESIIIRKSFDFAVQIIQLYRYLCNNKNEYVLSKQILRSGTSIGANVREAHNAESKADFIHKMGIAQKETDETIYWLELLQASNYLSDNNAESLRNEAGQLLKIIRSIIMTSKQNKL